MQKCTDDDSQKCQQASISLQHAIENMDREVLDVHKLYSIAHARMGLCITSTFIANIIQSGMSTNIIPNDIRKLIERAQILCEKFEHLK